MTSRSLARPLGLVVVLLVGHLAGTPAGAQGVGDASRLAGIEQVDTRAEAQWDEAITNSAGGATSGQFLEALTLSFREAMGGPGNGPNVVDGAPTTVTCHVDTYYETGLIVYSLRAQLETADADGARVIRWIESSVGSFTVQQLHLMFTLGEQCADSFLAAWASAN